MINFLLRKWYLSRIPHGHGKKVAVGLSGGVDSSVSAALLKERGYDVTGVFIKVWQPDFLTCTWKEDRRDAMRVCVELNIPFITIDLEKEYKKYVVDYMIDEYRSGHTPNPDIMCNTFVKFGAFYAWAMEHSFEYVATGHYAQIDSSHNLKKGKDASKDQSYFLWQIKQEQLPHIIFPVGNIAKKHVRLLAHSYALYTATKKDSQGLCFLGHVDMQDFLSHYIELSRGDIRDTKGNIIGSHKGAALYTIGQRHGFSVTDQKNAQKTLYVVKKDVKTNTIVVDDNPYTYSYDHTQVPLRNIYLRKDRIDELLYAHVRYHGKRYAITLKKNKDSRGAISFSEKPDGLAEGQSVVVYNAQDICVGGGVIDTPVIQ